MHTVKITITSLLGLACVTTWPLTDIYCTHVAYDSLHIDNAIPRPPLHLFLVSMPALPRGIVHSICARIQTERKENSHLVTTLYDLDPLSVTLVARGSIFVV